MSICSLIAAVSSNNVIGKDNDLIWYIPEDLKYFKRTTSGKPVVMGRKTFESIVDRIGTDISTALKAGAQAAEDEYFILGGAQIYAETINLCDRLYITEIHQDYEGDSHFPPIDKKIWQETSREDYPRQGADLPAYSFVVYTRI